MTFAIVFSAIRMLSESVCCASARTATPAYESGVVTVFSSEIVYSSGASETKAKWPRASVVVLALCDGLVTVTSTPAIGVAVPTSVTTPLMPPVVPAMPRIACIATTNARSNSPWLSFAHLLL